MKTENYKKPTLKEKAAQYEDFLHKINMFIVSCNNDGIAELVKNADSWSYAHRVGNGQLSEKKQQQAINGAFWTLCDTPDTDEKTKERQQKYEKAKLEKKVSW
jgi:hypothetical protein